MIEIEALEKELQFKFSRSSGKGGQHVNKVSTRVSLFFDIPQSTCLEDQQKAILFEVLAPQLSQHGVLQISSQQTRSQLRNKQLTILQLQKTLNKALQVKKQRKKTKTPASVKLKRRKDKQRLSEKKAQRKKLSGKYTAELFLN